MRLSTDARLVIACLEIKVEHTFRAANFYSSETDASSVAQPGPSGTPAVIAGSTVRGPAFVPITVATIQDFADRFGPVSKKHPTSIAAREFLSSARALTVIRTLGAGANSSSGEIAATTVTGRVKNAGFKLEGVAAPNDTRGRHAGCVQFIAARHALQSAEAAGYPIFTRNSSFTTSSGYVNLIRAAVFTATGSRLMVLDADASVPSAFASSTPFDVATPSSAGAFKLVLSSSDGSLFGAGDGMPGLRVYTASLDPSSQNYVGKLLNADPARFAQEQHLLWADYAVDAELASATSAVAVLSGSANTAAGAAESALSYRRAFGAFDARFCAPATPWLTSQPFGGVEHDLFRIVSLEHGEAATRSLKVTIRDLRASLDDSDQYGTFTLQIRDASDTDTDPIVLEQYGQCSLNPASANYVARLVGDRSVQFNFDSPIASERQLSVRGQYDNVSQRVRVEMSSAVERSMVPPRSLPFGFRGLHVLKTTDSMTDTPPLSDVARVTGVLSSSVGSALSGSILPPLPFRHKITRGATPAAPAWLGQPSVAEVVVPSLTWGVKYERVTSPLSSNVSSEKSALVGALCKFAGLEKLDALVTGSGADALCNNKFSLANVALYNTAVADVTASADVHMREAAYWRDARPDAVDSRVTDAVVGKRVTLATLLSTASPQLFNKFSPFAKFTVPMAGGFDGLNVMDAEEAIMSDRATSFDAGGNAASGYVPTGFASATAGTGVSNAVVASLRIAAEIATDPSAVDASVFALPGIREPYVVDYAAQRTKTHAAMTYVMDVPLYSSDSTRLFATSAKRPSADKTAQQFSSRAIDNSYAIAYAPDVFLTVDSGAVVRAPASVAALRAIAVTDAVAFPWFAPAGYARASLPTVVNAALRMSDSDRDAMSDARINPVTLSQDLGWAITGQKTLQLKKSALDRANVRRMLVDVKRAVLRAALRVIFEQNDAETRSKLKRAIELKLGDVKARAGVEAFEVVIDESNNSQDDVDLNKMNCAVRMVPTRSVEYVSIEFVVTRSGVIFA